MSRSTRLRRVPVRFRAENSPLIEEKIPPGRNNIQKEAAKVDVKKVDGKKEIKNSNVVMGPGKIRKRELRSTKNEDVNIDSKRETRSVGKNSKTEEGIEIENPTKIPRPAKSNKKRAKVKPPENSQRSTNTTRRKNEGKIDEEIIQVPEEDTSKKLSSASENTASLAMSKKISIKPEKSRAHSRRSLRSSTAEKNNNSLNKPGKRFFKSKRNISGMHSKISPMKRGLIKVKKVGSRKKNSSGSQLYQPTLQESFAKAKKSLRPRKIVQNYNEQSTIVEDKEKKGNNVIDKPKGGPVYKTLLNVEDEKTKEKDEVYEFSFDSNDSEECLPKKRKKKTVRKAAPAKRAKGVSKAHNSGPPVKRQPANKDEENSKDVVRQEAIHPPTIQQDDAGTNDDDAQPNSPVDKITETLEVTAEIHAPLSPRIDGKELEGISIIHKPKIVSTEKLEGERRISLTSTPLQSNEDRPLRQLNPFTRQPSSQFKTMMNHSLIRRSFSPIVKQKNDENFDVNSPWRPLAPNAFSNINKNIYQSTPHAKKFLTPHGISSLAAENKRGINKINKIMEQEDENKNSSVFNGSSPQKSPRKFGTVLSNINPSPMSPRISSSSENESLRENKENSPVKNKEKIQKTSTTVKQHDNFILHKSGQKPGLSGLVTTCTDSKILKQSNLNSFLNIPEMPASTTITTPHGIFDDAHSTPIPCKTVSKAIKNFNVDNAFGFEEENTFDLSPISENRKEEVAVIKKHTMMKVTADSKRSTIQRPVRLSTETVRRILTEKNLNKIDKIEEITSDGEKAPTAKNPENKNLSAVDEQFEITCDSNDGTEYPAEVSLFCDPEPVHFKQAPRYSYSKRKRAVKFDNESSSSEGEDDDDNYPRHKPKKRKMTKAAKEQLKQLDNWAKSINETFNEIDNFDLVVE